MDKIQYMKAIKDCILYEDIESFSHGHITDIGERIEYEWRKKIEDSVGQSTI